MPSRFRTASVACSTRGPHAAHAAWGRSPHFHFHLVVIDGLFSQADDSALRFHEVTRLSAQDIERTERAVQRRVLRLFVRRGLIEDYVAADMLTWQAAGGFSIHAAVRVEQAVAPKPVPAERRPVDGGS